MQVPESVQAYFADGGVRRAVCQLLEISRDEQILEGLGWSELERFYRAQMAARQFESDWAIFGLRAWEDIWNGLLGNWTALSPDDQMDPQHEAALNLSSLTDTGDDSLWFGRLFAKGSWLFYASLWGVPAAGLKIKVACVNGKRSVRFSEIADAADELGNWEPDVAVSVAAAEVDLTALREVAQQAAEIADAECTSMAK
jgi:hypothetical protein